MLSIRQLARIALRYDTTMSRAMLRALGIPAPEPMPCAGQVVEAGETDPDVAWCFENHGSPMDRMR